MKKPKDMTVKELQSTLKKTRADRATMRMRVSGNPNLSAYDKQIEECEKDPDAYLREFPPLGGNMALLKVKP